MTKAEFIGALTEKLLAAGITPEEFEPDLAAILSQTDKLKGREFQSIFYNENIVDGFAFTIIKKVESKRNGQNDTEDSDMMIVGESEKTKTFSTVDSPEQISEEAPTASFTPVRKRAKNADKNPETVKKQKPKKVSSTPKFVFVATVSSPLSLVGLILAGVAISLPYIIVSAAIFALIAAMCCIVAVGAAGTLIGVIYGITRLFSEISVGLYEIGLGLVVLGISGAFSLLSFNAAIRYLPRLYKYLKIYAGYLTATIRSFTDSVKRRCGGI